jgi:mono/diheme cytochrome c family protein
MSRVVPLLLLALALAVLGVACGGDSSEGEATTPVATPTAPAAPAETATPAGSETMPAEGGADAAAIYAGNCAGCHGADGGGSSAPSIAGEDDVDRIREQIREGGDGMPSFSGTLTAPQIDALAQFVAGGLQ